MSDHQLLIKSLKKELKNQGIKYRDLAAALEISEASVKRMFSEENFSLQRLNDICMVLGIGFTDLANRMKSEERRTDQLTKAQEQELVSDPKLLLMAFLVINGWQFGDIPRAYHYSETEIIRHLAKLDRIGIIELLPNNRIKLLISPKFSWLKNGPMQNFFVDNLQKDFLHHAFSGEREKHYFLTAMLSDEPIRELEKKVEQLVKDFKVFNLQDIHEPLERRETMSLMVGMRCWRPPVFDGLRKP